MIYLGTTTAVEVDAKLSIIDNLISADTIPTDPAQQSEEDKYVMNKYKTVTFDKGSHGDDLTGKTSYKVHPDK
ncbi:hypothetical protein [Dolosicoccus paucivorans]